MLRLKKHLKHVAKNGNKNVHTQAQNYNPYK